MTAGFRSHLASVRSETADPEVRLLIDAVLREEPEALAAVRSNGRLAGDLLRGLRAPFPTQKARHLRLVGPDE